MPTNFSTFMLHEINEAVLDKLLKISSPNYILTFDDGLYSQYYYWPEIKKIPVKKIFFISSGILSNGQQSTTFPTCQEAHEKAFNGNFEDYMTTDQVKELLEDPLVEVGGHGHSHKHPNLFTTEVSKIQYILEDTRKMMSWFSSQLGFFPTSFCFPYNDDFNKMYSGILRTKFGITDFYGRGRLEL